MRLREGALLLGLSLFGCQQQQGQMIQFLILLMLPLSDSTSLLAVWRRQLHRGEYTETQRMWKLQGTVLQNKDVFLVILASENLYKTKNFYFMQFSEAQFPFPVCLNSTPYCWLLNATKERCYVHNIFKTFLQQISNDYI